MRRILSLLLFSCAALPAQQVPRVSHLIYPDLVFAPGAVGVVDLSSPNGVFCADLAKLAIVVRSGEVDYPVSTIDPGCHSIFHIQLPRDVPSGHAELRIQTGSREYSPVGITVVPSRFGLTGVSRDGDGRAPSLTNPVLAGRTITVQGTGLGTATPDDVQASMGPDPEQAGAEEIRFRLPSPLSFTGCYVPLELRVGDTVANLLSMPIAQTTGACRHPLGLSTEQQQLLDAGRAIALGSVDIIGETRGGIYATFQFATARTVEAVVGPQYPAGRFGCTLGKWPPIDTRNLGAWTLPPTFLDAGNFQATDPAGRTTPLQVLLDMKAGDWRLQSSGGNDVTAFGAAFRLPSVPRMLDVPREATYGPEQEIRLRWDPSGYDADDEMTLSLSSLSCVAPARDGAMTMPLGALLLQANGALKSPFEVKGSARISRRPGADVLFPYRLVNGVDAVGLLTYTLSAEFSMTLREVIR